MMNLAQTIRANHRRRVRGDLDKAIAALREAQRDLAKARAEYRERTGKSPFNILIPEKYHADELI